MYRILAILLLFCLLPGRAVAEQQVRVLTSFSILADLVSQVGGDKVEVDSLVGPDSDAHAFRPSPVDARKLAQSDLLVINGLGYESWFKRLVEASDFQGPVVVASDGIKPIMARDMGNGHSHDDGHDHGPTDPHAWHDINSVIQYVENIRENLAELDPVNSDYYTRRASIYEARLRLLDSELEQAFAAIEPSQRKVITSHAAFEYLGRAYQIRFYAAQGITTESKSSAAHIASLIRLINAQGIQAMFVENTADARMLEQISRETGIDMGGRLYSDALAREGEASTYMGLMRYNADQLLSALAPES